MREGVVEKTGDQPLTGLFRRQHEELLVVLSNTVLNLASSESHSGSADFQDVLAYRGSEENF